MNKQGYFGTNFFLKEKMTLEKNDIKKMTLKK